MHINSLGSTSQATDYRGATAQDQLYYPWGQEWNTVGNTQEKRFARLGHRDTTEIGLDPTHFRMFSCTQGRWLSRDPRPGCIQHPQSLNLYSYVHNSPTNKVDPHSPAKSVSTGLNKCIENAKCSMEPAWIVWNYSSRDARLSGVHQLWIFRTRRHPRMRR